MPLSGVWTPGEAGAGGTGLGAGGDLRLARAGLGPGLTISLALASWAVTEARASVSPGEMAVCHLCVGVALLGMWQPPGSLCCVYS